MSDDVSTVVFVYSTKSVISPGSYRLDPVGEGSKVTPTQWGVKRVRRDFSLHITVKNLNDDPSISTYENDTRSSEGKETEVDTLHKTETEFIGFDRESLCFHL